MAPQRLHSAYSLRHTNDARRKGVTLDKVALDNLLQPGRAATPPCVDAPCAMAGTTTRDEVVLDVDGWPGLAWGAEVCSTAPNQTGM